MDWDDQFCVTLSKDNLFKPIYFREYFDSTPFRTVKSGSSTLKSTRRSPLSKLTSISRTQKRRETKWDDRFSVLKPERGTKTRTAREKPLKRTNLRTRFKYNWNNALAPLSERNLLKHPLNRKYFS